MGDIDHVTLGKNIERKAIELKLTGIVLNHSKNHIGDK